MPLNRHCPGPRLATCFPPPVAVQAVCLQRELTRCNTGLSHHPPPFHPSTPPGTGAGGLPSVDDLGRSRFDRLEYLAPTFAHVRHDIPQSALDQPSALEKRRQNTACCRLCVGDDATPRMHLGLGWPKGLGGRLLPLELSSSFVPTIHGGMTQSFGDASTNGLEWSRRGRHGDGQDRSTTLFSHCYHKPSGRRTELAARSSFPIEPWLRSLKHDALCILHVAFCILHLAEYCIATDSLLH